VHLFILLLYSLCKNLLPSALHILLALFTIFYSRCNSIELTWVIPVDTVSRMLFLGHDGWQPSPVLFPLVLRRFLSNASKQVKLTHTFTSFRPALTLRRPNSAGVHKLVAVSTVALTLPGHTVLSLLPSPNHRLRTAGISYPFLLNLVQQSEWPSLLPWMHFRPILGTLGKFIHIVIDIKFFGCVL
jgi:hypothetical protein